MPQAQPSDYFSRAIALAATALAVAGSVAAMGLGLMLGFPDKTAVVRFGVAFLVVGEILALIGAIRAWTYYRRGSALLAASIGSDDQ